jgi:putative FmdB family regulatory protein
VPTYQYTCTDCGEPVEALQKFTDPPLSVCAACGGRLRKVFSPVGIVFKGSGFYRTDNRNGSSTLAAEKAEKAEKKDKQSSDSGSASTSKDSASSNGSSDKPAKKSEPATASSKSSSSTEKVA